jgi:hypothetical protein
MTKYVLKVDHDEHSHALKTGWRAPGPIVAQLGAFRHYEALLQETELLNLRKKAGFNFIV